MDKLENSQRLENLYQQLLAMLNGDYFQQIERTNSKDHLEALSVLVNMITEQIRGSIMRLGFSRPFYSYTVVTQMLFFLDRSRNIIKMNNGVKKLLHYEENDILGLTFKKLLYTDSHKVWDQGVKGIISGPERETTLQLSFLTNYGLLFPAQCKVLYFPDEQYLNQKIIVTSIKVSLQREAPEDILNLDLQKTHGGRTQIPKNKKGHKYILNTLDIEMIHSIKKYIVAHLNESIPDILDLAHTMGTNEYKLKNGFKELYGMTVFQFIKDQRLRKAHTLIQYTNKKIGYIARSVGFKQGNHLAREFKKRYGYTPTELRLLSSHLNYYYI
ncbi:helix-turn-helix domain-containing protein [Arenibacter sp. S6351L]|uniref:helix-turn-helix domain-containing protein n=1 Tax=Arenibacter sp. S6351L TaxID=2926407 RepID=UPI001FF5552B|nr:helix-turn-helix domain-containing protein [Arenibacter sp. S6351L]MCK0134174.1 AraC family transcriptional regulator [Arenibacter sp. S6351L]